MVAREVYTLVRAEVDDSEQDYATDAYINPHLNRAQSKVMEEFFQNPNIGRFKAMVVLQNVPAGTTTLASYMKDNQSLALLDEILDMKEKTAGASDAQYRPMNPALVPPVTVSQDFNNTYTYTGDDLLLPGAQQALDIRIWGHFKPKPITAPESPILPGCENAIISLTAARVARAHGNRQLGADLLADYEESLNTITCNIVMQQQLEPSRPRGYSEDQLSAGLNTVL